MVQKIIKNLIANRHPWRLVDFDELGELYVSMMFRNLALSLIGIFVPIYLYGLGFSIQTILIFYATMFLFRVPWDIFVAYIVARIGPKHAMTFSYVLQVINLSLLVTLESYGWPLWIIAITTGMSSGLFFIAYHVDFSKIKHSRHGGKELGFMTFMERLGSVIGPVVGGILATFFDVKYSFVAAIGFFIIGIIPMFLSAEPVKTKQNIHFKGLPFGRIKSDLTSYSALGIENNVCLVLWPLFISIFVLTDGVYFKVGVLASLGALVTVVSARAIGKLIDERQGRTMLRYSLIANIMIHMTRPFTNSFGFALGLNMTNDVATVGYRMPFAKGWYDKADDLPGYRIAYISFMESTCSLSKASFYFLLAFISFMVTDRALLNLGFGIGILASVVIMSEKFPALNAKRIRS